MPGEDVNGGVPNRMYPEIHFASERDLQFISVNQEFSDWESTRGRLPSEYRGDRLWPLTEAILAHMSSDDLAWRVSSPGDDLHNQRVLAGRLLLAQELVAHEKQWTAVNKNLVETMESIKREHNSLCWTQPIPQILFGGDDEAPISALRVQGESSASQEASASTFLPHQCCSRINGESVPHSTTVLMTLPEMMQAARQRMNKRGTSPTDADRNSDFNNNEFILSASVEAIAGVLVVKDDVGATNFDGEKQARRAARHARRVALATELARRLTDGRRASVGGGASDDVHLFEAVRTDSSGGFSSVVRLEFD